jgi:tubulin polyglutamylase TTLL6/13
VKPDSSCQGKGIYLTKNPETLLRGEAEGLPVEHMVVQRYLTRPYLLDGFKFDFRLYVLVNGIAPMRIYLYEDGLARLATEQYQKPAPNNLGNLFMHLTNYAINKESENYVQNTSEKEDNVGSKRSYFAVVQQMRLKHGDTRVDEMVQQIHQLIIKTMCIAQPHCFHLFRSCQADDTINQMCF